MLDFFDYSWFINLAHRTDRFDEVTQEFERIGISPARFPGILREGATRQIRTGGTTESHLAVIREFKKSGKEMVVVFEDDAIFHPDFLDLFPPVLAELKKMDWGFFFFQGGESDDSLIGPPCHEYYPATQSYAVKRDIVDILIEVLEAALVPHDNNNSTIPIDTFLSGHSDKIRAVASVKKLATQRTSFSDVCDRVSHSHNFRYNIRPGDTD